MRFFLDCKGTKFYWINCKKKSDFTKKISAFQCSFLLTQRTLKILKKSMFYAYKM